MAKFYNSRRFNRLIAINRTASDLEIINILALAIDHSDYEDTNGIVEAAKLKDVVDAVN